MVRTVNAKPVRPLSKKDRVFLLPSPAEATPWESWSFDDKSKAEHRQNYATPLDLRRRKNATLVLPIAQVFCLPLWLNETDAKQFKAMIPLQLELHGLQPRGIEPAVFDWSVVAQEAGRTLVVVGILPSLFPVEINAQAYDNFEVSARCLPLAESTLTFWLEQGCWVIAITRGRNLVYFQVLAEGRITQRVLQDLQCVLAALVMQGILVPLVHAMVWGEISSAEITALHAVLKIPVHRAERPSPQLPATAWKLIPAMVSTSQKTRAIQRWRNRGIMIGLGLYFIVVACLLLRLGMTWHQVDDLRQWQKQHAQALAMVRDTRTIWTELAPVVDEKNYPLELLLQISQAIPANQLNLTLFEADNGHLLIKGEAQNAAAAFQFLDNLKKNPQLAGYAWNMGQPHLLPNDLAQLQIEGTYGTAN